MAPAAQLHRRRPRRACSPFVRRLRARVNRIGINTWAAAFLALTASYDAAPQPAEELVFVGAVFRHGVRPPLANFAASAGKYSANAWPDEKAWGSAWGNLTPRGAMLAKILGTDYARGYGLSGLDAYLWADVDERTRATAQGLASGLSSAGVKVSVGGLTGSAPDPLFHPFKAGCGTPDPAKVGAIVARVNTEAPAWIKTTYRNQFQALYGVLGCSSAPGVCKPLSGESDTATACTDRTKCSAPIDWKGQFSYASSASEAFLLEYANGMPDATIGWGKAMPPKLQSMLALHEFYFDQLDRDEYLARLQASNLAREVFGALNRKAGKPVVGCPHGGMQRFIGWVGHDTDLASLGELLGLSWRFDLRTLPPDTRDLPANDALPAGALVFELYRRGDNHFVRIAYTTLSLQQMRNAGGAPPIGPAFRLPVYCRTNGGAPCGDISLPDFNEMATRGIGKEFLSRCEAGGRQTCS